VTVIMSARIEEYIWQYDRYCIKLIQSQLYKSLSEFYIADKSINWDGFQFALKIYYIFAKFQALLIVTIFSIKRFLFWWARSRDSWKWIPVARSRWFCDWDPGKTILTDEEAFFICAFMHGWARCYYCTQLCKDFHRDRVNVHRRTGRS